MARSSYAVLAFMAFFLAAAPTLAQAADESRDSGIWLASDQFAGGGGGAYGVLTLGQGRLVFRSMNGSKSWEVKLATARRIEISKTASRVLEIESLSGELFAVAILNAQMLTDSPRKALQAINTAAKNVGTDTSRLAASAASVPAGSAKVVRLDGGQVR